MKKMATLCALPVLLAAGCVSHERDFDRHFTDFSDLLSARSITARWEVRNPVLRPVPAPVQEVQPVVPPPGDVPAVVVEPVPGGGELRTNTMPQRAVRVANPAPAAVRSSAGSKGSLNSSSGGAVVPSRSSSSGKGVSPHY